MFANAGLGGGDDQRADLAREIAHDGAGGRGGGRDGGQRKRRDRGREESMRLEGGANVAAARNLRFRL